MKLTTTVLSSGWHKWRYTNTLKANSHIPCRAHAALWLDLEQSLIERHGRSTSGARHGYGIASGNQTLPHCVNQIGKTRSKPLATRWQGDGMDTSCYVWISLKTSRLKQLTNRLLPIPRIRLNSWLNATVSLVGALENPPTLKIYAFVMGMMSPPPRQPRSWLSVG